MSSKFDLFLLVYTELSTTVVTQVLAIPFSGSASLLQFHLTLIAGNVKVLEQTDESVTFLVFNEVTVLWQSTMVRIKVGPHSNRIHSGR